MLKIGICGYGDMGKAMEGVLRERGLGEVVAACDISPQALELARSRGLKATTDPRDLCAQDLDAVIVASTNCAHHEHVMAAAEAGKHVLCEKPPALSLAHLDEMIAAVESRKLVSVVNYGMRLSPAHVRIKRMADAGELGELLSVTQFTSRGWGLAMHGNPHTAVARPELSGGWLLHHACHGVDFITWLLGPADTAYCRGRSTAANADSPEVIWGLTTHARGAIGVVGDTVAAIRQAISVVVGSRATVELMRTPQGEVLHMRAETGKEFPYTEDILGFETVPYLVPTLRDFVTCIRDGRKSANDLRSTRDSFRAALALEESRRTGRVVTL